MRVWSAVNGFQRRCKLLRNRRPPLPSCTQLNASRLLCPNVEGPRVADHPYRRELIHAAQCHLRRGNIRRDCDIHLVHPNQPRANPAKVTAAVSCGRPGGCTQHSGRIFTLLSTDGADPV